MKINKWIFNIRGIICLLFLLSFLSSCKKDKDEETITPTDSTNGPMGNLRVHLHTYLEENEVDGYNINYTTTNGRKISVSKAKVFLSNFELVKLDGSIFTVPNSIILQMQGQSTYTIGKVPAGNYKGISFNVGLDPTTNKKNPTVGEVLNDSDMWFGSTAQPEGFVFLNFQGKIDTTTHANGTDTQMKQFMYFIGTDANYKKVIMPDKNFSIIPDQTEYLHISADYNRLFNGVQLNKSSDLTVMTISENSSDLAKKISDNIPLMFNYEM